MHLTTELVVKMIRLALVISIDFSTKILKFKNYDLNLINDKPYPIKIMAKVKFLYTKTAYVMICFTILFVMSGC